MEWGFLIFQINFESTPLSGLNEGCPDGKSIGILSAGGNPTGRVIAFRIPPRSAVKSRYGQNSEIPSVQHVQIEALCMLYISLPESRIPQPHSMPISSASIQTDAYLISTDLWLEAISQSINQTLFLHFSPPDSVMFKAQPV